MKRILKSIAILSLIGFASCSSLSHKKNEEAMAKVKKAAIIGFAVREPATLGLNPREVKETRLMYDELLKSFGKKAKWQIVPEATFKANAAYQAAYQKTMKGWQNKMPPGQHEHLLFVDGVMDNDCLRILGADGRTALMKALGVDALVTAEVDVLISANTVMGFGSRYPYARLSFQVFTPGQSTADWFEGGISGDESKTSIGATGFVDGALMNKLALESARTAFNRIGDPIK